MKKNDNISKFSMALFLLFAWGSSAQNCTSAAIAHLDVNNVDAIFKQGGRFWTTGGSPGYIVPKGNTNQVSSIFAGSLWVGGVDANGEIHISLSTYGDSEDGNNCGPLINGQVDPAICENFDRFWEITVDEITAHNADFADNGTIDNPIPNIMKWPGKGNPESITANGFALPAGLTLAPYNDANQNGIYDPMSGDSPTMKGDKSLWWMYNKMSFPLNANAPIPFFNIGVLAYAASNVDEIVDNSTYYDVKMEYLGPETLTDFHAVLWVDADLGCHVDDYVGCFPEEDFAFVYNMDAQDGSVGCDCPDGIPTYCETVPMISFKMLQGLTDDSDGDLGMTSFIVYNNSGIGNPPTGTADPNNTPEYFNLLQGKWKDGSPITTGGDGYLSTGPETKYIFPGSPADPNAWSMCQAQLQPLDRRMLMSTGPVTMQPSAIQEVSFAVVWIADQNYPCPDIQPLAFAGQEAAKFSLVASPVIEEGNFFNHVTVTPNPMGDAAVLRAVGTSSLERVSLMSLDGKTVRNYQSLGSNELTIEKNGLTAGIYVYRAYLSNGDSSSGKLVVY